MKVLVIGGGGREHAIAWRLADNGHNVFVCPGNPGIRQCFAGSDYLAVARELKVDLTVVGPEAPLVAGAVDEFRAAGLLIAGPTAACAQLEASKIYSKQFMDEVGIPTARFVRTEDRDTAIHALNRFALPVVVKADGLAAGKGVVIAKSKDEAATVANEMLSGRMLGEAGSRVVLEEFLEGDELSFLVVSDGERVAPLVAAQDHKRVGDGDGGPNTGGMGAYTTRTIVDDQMRDWLLAHIARPVVAGMKAEGTEYKGVLYCGLMMTARGPMVLEFNCRFGDPETQPILMRLESDLIEAMEASIDGRTSDGDFKWSNDAAVCVVMASGGYPGAYEAGKRITGLDDAAKLDGVKVFHASTSKRDNAFYTSGGRVLGVTARAAELETAVQRAYEACAKIGFEGAHYRKDIAARALKKN